jgi:Domain of unknown function (DUF1737)
MTEPIVEYTLVFGTAQIVVKQVNEKIEQGFQPLGAPFAIQMTYGVSVCQAMVKRERSKASPNPSGS